MNQPTITITIDPLKGPTISSNVPDETTYLILSGTCNNILLRILSQKQTNHIQTGGKVSLVS